MEERTRRGPRRERTHRGRGRGRPRRDGRPRGPPDARKKVQTTGTQQKGTVQREGGSKKSIIIVIIALVILIGAGVFLSVYLTSGESEEVAVTTTPVPFSGAETTTIALVTGTTTPSPFTDDRWRSIRGDCGVPKQKPYLGRIVGGTEAVKHSWPWQIGLLKYKKYDAKRVSVQAICGGSLVGPRFVITASHCFLNSARTTTSTTSDDYRVLVGAHDKGKPTGGARLIEIESINHHPQNNLAVFTALREIPKHDITVLVLKSVIDPNIPSPITTFVCLPKPKVIPPVGKRCWASGWGKTLNTGFDKVLKQVAQPIVSEYACQKKYGSKHIKSETHLCGGPEKGSQGTCQGDSGGPLVCQEDDGTWVLYGDTSFGPRPCGSSAGVWAQISYHMDWVCCIIRDYGPCKEIKCVMP